MHQFPEMRANSGSVLTAYIILRILIQTTDSAVMTSTLHASAGIKVFSTAMLHSLQAKGAKQIVKRIEQNETVEVVLSENI